MDGIETLVFVHNKIVVSLAVKVADPYLLERPAGNVTAYEALGQKGDAERGVDCRDECLVIDRLHARTEVKPVGREEPLKKGA